MRPRGLWSLALAALLCAVAASGRAEEIPDRAKEEAALFKNAEAFVEAFHKGDAKALAAFWTADGDYVDQKGHHLKGRPAIEKTFAGLFTEHKGLKLRIDINALRFVSPDVAVEDGVTEVIPPDGGPPSRARYTIVHVKKDGKWLLSSVRDAAFAPANNAEHLGGLEWLLGDWVEDGAGPELARASFAWSQNQNFMTSSFVRTFKNISLGGGTQWIGWDPTARHIRSWSFDADGGFGEGVWTNEGSKWVIKTTTTLRDGKKVTATNVVTKVDADAVTWQATQVTVDGKAMPDGKVVKMKRVK
jgi:uncharacterized protein (TIGR02246 family)